MTQPAPSGAPGLGWWARAPLGLPMALTLAAWLSVGQANLLLRQFQQADTQAYGISALGGGLRISPETASEAVRLWKGFNGATADEARAFVISYT
ncbi:MAG: hypothetical protein ACRDO2_03540, partial [Nocardioidaceae bacterium]